MNHLKPENRFILSLTDASNYIVIFQRSTAILQEFVVALNFLINNAKFHLECIRYLIYIIIIISSTFL